ncbi:MAG: hypothetical protein HGA39_04840 [Coriobacteriia bacterium]|nr:hypothetical protein [Coriobacteriia bacterium]
MEKRDLKKELRHLYGPSVREVVPVEVPAMNFLMIDGEGDPNTSPAYAEAVEALFALSYALKFAMKKGPLAIDYGVMPLEGLWWADDMSSFTTAEKSGWKWTMMIMQPDPVGVDLFKQTLVTLDQKKVLPALRALRFETLAEGLSAQVMHVGPFADEGPTIDRVHEFIRLSGHERFGKHHEIYLSDVRKAAPSAWKTIIRQPMR